jgi:hypothetical protein
MGSEKRAMSLTKSTGQQIRGRAYWLLTMLGLVSTLFISTAWAATSQVWEMTGFQDFLRGKSQAMQLTKDGRLIPGETFSSQFQPGESAIWSVLETPQATYLGTGGKGRLYVFDNKAVDNKGAGKLFWTGDKAAIFALTQAKDGSIIAATSPAGKIWKIDAAGKASVLFDPKVNYIWSLATGSDGTIYAGADSGKVFRISPNSAGELFVETGQRNVTSLAFDATGKLLIGTDPNGILYRAEGKGKVFALFDSDQTEIRKLVTESDGSVLIAAMGGSTAAALQPTATAGSTTGAAASGTPSVSVTITEAEPVKAAAVTGLTGSTESAAGTQPTVTSGIVETASTTKSALLRMKADTSVETLWSSADESIYDVIKRGETIRFGTDKDARVYEWRASKSGKGQVTLLGSVEGESVNRLTESGFVSSAQGQLFRLLAAKQRSSFQSPVQDFGYWSKWGRWQCQLIGEGNVAFRSRSGNSATPNDGWSAWSDPQMANATTCSGTIASPAARYLQWRLEWSSGRAALDSLAVYSSGQNRRPEVKTLTATATYGTTQSLKALSGATSSAAATYSVTVTDSGDEIATTPTGSLSQIMVRQTYPQLMLVWTAEDADGDRLLYDVAYKTSTDDSWVVLKKAISDTSLTLESESLGEGKLIFRVTASDAGGNVAGTGLESDLVSSPVQLDVTPPRIEVTGATTATGWEGRIRVVDTVSAIKKAEMSVDGGSWQLLAAVDGMADSLSEEFVAKVSNLEPGTHYLVFRTQDAGENSALNRVKVQKE